VRRALAVGAALASTILGTGCVVEVNQYAADLRNAPVIVRPNRPANERYIGPASSDGTGVAGMSRDTCTWMIDQHTDWTTAWTACAVLRPFIIGDHGYIEVP